jgi:hypothetical protein
VAKNCGQKVLKPVKQEDGSIKQQLAKCGGAVYQQQTSQGYGFLCQSCGHFKLDWNNLIRVDIREALDFFRQQGIKPTLRTLYYRLVSQNKIPNKITSYKGLSRQFVKARQQGWYPMDSIADTARQIHGTFDDYEDIDGDYSWQSSSMENRQKRFNILDLIEKEALPSSEGWTIRVGHWGGQPEVCQVWIEKEALTSAFTTWLSDLSVQIVPNRGYSSWTFIYQNVQSLKQLLQAHDTVYVFYAGDFDPSGLDIDRFLQEALDFFGISRDRVIFERICLSFDQVQEYDLPPNPTKAADSRSAWYVEQYGSECWELDALLAHVPEEFKRLVREPVENLWDTEVWDQLQVKRQLKLAQLKVDRLTALQKILRMVLDDDLEEIHERIDELDEEIQEAENDLEELEG